MPERFKVVFIMQGAIQVLGFTFTFISMNLVNIRRVDLWRNLCTSLLYSVVDVRCRRKKSSRPLSHLVMSFLSFSVMLY